MKLINKIDKTKLSCLYNCNVLGNKRFEDLDYNEYNKTAM